jgi:hypothetical protein
MTSTRAVHPSITAAQRTAAANRTSTGEVMVETNGVEPSTSRRFPQAEFMGSARATA